ncbi:restriction endonuclease [Halorubrum xinjiangense]|uniref:restriction endonuclease n=1 Tax=Halorubrum xinjiangense TaxID=261291 RepID=UPI003C6F8910
MSESDMIQSLRNDLSPEQFEHLIADLWTLQDWNTEKTSNKSDKGIDVIATRTSPYKEKCLIQAKKYGKNSSVSSPEIQKYASLKQREGVDTVVIVTTSEFTKEALELIDDFNLKHINGSQLVDFIGRLDAEELVNKYALENKPAPEVERPSYTIQQENESTDESIKTEEPELITVSSEHQDLSIELVATSNGRSLDPYLKEDVIDVEDQMSVIGRKTFPGRLIVFLQAKNSGNRLESSPDYFTFVSSDGYEYDIAIDSVTGITGANLQGRWKAADFEIAHGQTQYWTIISKTVPEDIKITSLEYDDGNRKMELDFSEEFDKLLEQNAMTFSS